MRIVFLIMFLSFCLFSQTINDQIHSLESANPQERVALMNNIKEQLISMNEGDRMQTLMLLRAKLQPKRESLHDGNEVSSRVDEHKDINNHTSEKHNMGHGGHEELSQMHQELHQHEHQQNHQKDVTTFPVEQEIPHPEQEHHPNVGVK